MVEYQPSKLVAWVRFPSPAPKTILTTVAVVCTLVLLGSLAFGQEMSQ